MSFYSFSSKRGGKNTKQKKREYLYIVKGVTKCAICGEFVEWADATLEHLTPKSKGGSDQFNNLSISHKRCNVRRGNTPLGLLKRTIALEEYLKTPIKDVVIVRDF